MKKAGLFALLLGAALVLPGCGFEEGAGATVTVIEATPTPIPEPTKAPKKKEKKATPTPEAEKTHQTAGGYTITEKNGTYRVTAESGINVRPDCSTAGDPLNGSTTVPAGTELKATGICENGEVVKLNDGESTVWIEIDYNGSTGYVCSAFVEEVAGDTADAAPAEETVAE